MRRLPLAVFAFVVLCADSLTAQQPGFFACFVPNVGALYLIKRTGTPAACVAPAHVEVSWPSSLDSAGGDVRGGLSDLRVVGLNGLPIRGAAPVDGQVLAYSATGSGWQPTTPAAGVTTHNGLTGLGADDHPQYVLANGSRALGGNLTVTGTASVAGRFLAGADGSLSATGDAGARFSWLPFKGSLRAGIVDGTQWDVNNVGVYSAAFGFNTVASGGGSFAAGWESQATGLMSTALGVGSVASGPRSVALAQAIASGEYAVAMGNAVASEVNAVAIGNGANASGARAVALGAGAKATAEFAMALGIGVTASARAATALGEITQAQGTHSLAAGLAAIAAAPVSFAWGEATQVDATAHHSFAVGNRAATLFPGTFTWADNANNIGFNAIVPNEFAARATGGVRFVTAVNGELPTAGVFLLPGGGSWSSMSDRHAKTDIETVDVADVLERVGQLPLTTWRYRTQDSVRHIGPMAQDFYAAFGVGEDERLITAVDADGVALAAVQALLQRLRTAEARIAELERRLETTRSR